MKNYLKEVERNLRYIAKRNKNITYSISLVLMYLMLGINAFSEEIKSVASKQDIGMSADRLSEVLNSIKAENEKKLKGANLELVQLMEQGNQVVKSPWSSWQFGMNYMYENWSGTYSGRGDKKEKYPFEGIFTRSNDIFERSTSPLSENYKELPVSTNPYAASTNVRTGLGSGYGLASTKEVQEPISVLNVDASIRPKDVYRNPVQAPTVSINAPTFQALNVPNLTPPVVDIPEPEIVEVPNKTPMVDAKPVSSYAFHQRAIQEGGSVYNDVVDGKNKTFWSGWDADNNRAEPNNSKVQIKNATGEPGLEGWRVPNVFYLNTGKRPRPDQTPSESKWLFHDATVHVMGDKNAVHPNVIGQIAMHTVWDGTIKNVQGYLHGYSTLISSETWHSGRVKLENVKVDVKGEYNSVFYGYPSSYFSLGVDNWDYHSYLQRGEYDGDLHVTINNANNNYVYTILGAQGAFKIKSTGKYDIKGNNNIVYLGLGYSPNWQNLKGNGDGSDINKSTMDMTPSIQLGQQHPISIDGDSNVALFFENRYGSKNTPHYDSGRGGEIGSAERWAKSIIGIYQGEIDVNANIGENSVSISNVGVYSRSGQREGIKPSEDLGSPTDTIRADVKVEWKDDKTGIVHTQTYPNKHPQYDFDKIHNLEVAAAKIYFGKYSTNGIMFAADKGTVIDVGKANKKNKNLTSDEANTQVTSSTEIKDSAGKLTSSFDNTNNQAATGTVIAYATGVWDNKDMPGGVAAGLKGKGSEINIYVPITMSGRAVMDASNKLNPSVALIGDNKGIINAKGSVTAKGYSSIIALAQKKGKVNVEGTITAKDEWAAKDSATKPYLYNNVGAYAGSGGIVTINGGHDIYGIGAMASGENSIVDLKGKGTIETGKGAALVATNKGVVNYYGGTIIHKEHEAGDHDGTTPLYADDSSHINFKGATTVNISHGILMPGKSKDYDAKDTGTAKYNGMENVTVNLTGNNVILATNNGETTNWTGNTSGSNGVKESMKLAALNTNGKDYKIYYINGIFNLNNNLNLDDNTDEFNKNIGLSNEQFNIAANVVVSSASGKGLAMGSNE
ncbi:autotransporter-associated N-terminal domain-containing protein, partial [Fusobacterium russii]|uniref:autotransporter-associated N-terminal domain-containing protein n=1 Tax=Fusobacterium russii TaxID=854 RepID=UPI0003B5F119